MMKLRKNNIIGIFGLCFSSIFFMGESCPHDANPVDPNAPKEKEIQVLCAETPLQLPDLYIDHIREYCHDYTIEEIREKKMNVKSITINTKYMNVYYEIAGEYCSADTDGYDEQRKSFLDCNSILKSCFVCWKN